MSFINTTPPAPKPRILMTGLRVSGPMLQYFRDLYGTPSEIETKIDADTQRIKASGYDVTLYYMDDEGPQTGLDWLEKNLKDGAFKGVMIGSGLRLIPPQTPLFEKVVNVARRASPGSVVMFNDGPGGNFEAIMRNRESLG